MACALTKNWYKTNIHLKVRMFFCFTILISFVKVDLFWSQCGCAYLIKKFKTVYAFVSKNFRYQKPEMFTNEKENQVKIKFQLNEDNNL